MNKQAGVSLIEAMVAAVVVGIGFCYLELQLPPQECC